MHCSICLSEWKIGKSCFDVKTCPVCGADYDKFADQKLFDSIEELLVYLLICYGSDICDDPARINAYLNDYFPGESEKRGKINQLMELGINKYIKECITGVNLLYTEEYVNGLNTESDKLSLVDSINYLLNGVKEEGDVFDKEYYIRQSRIIKNEAYRRKALEQSINLGAGVEAEKELFKIISKNASDEDIEKRLRSISDKGDSDFKILFAEFLVEKRRYTEAKDVLKDISDGRIGDTKYLDGIIQYRLDDKEGADELFTESINKGCYKAGCYLYRILMEKGKQREAVNRLKQAADGGVVPAMYEYAVHKLYGDGVDQSVSEALDYLERAASNGSYDAKEQLYFMYNTGYMVSIDRSRAIRYKGEMKNGII